MRQSRAVVKAYIEETLDEGLPEAYDAERYEYECNELYQHVFDSYRSGDDHRYVQAA